MTTLASAIPVAFISVSSRDAGLGFYRDTLGLTHASGDDFGDFFDIGGGRMRMTAMPDFKGGAHPVFGLQVNDIAATVTDLKAKGVAMTIYEGMGQDQNGIWTAPDGVNKVAWFADPDGNVLSLNEG
jgi:predicted enzyme related to lactoylglutathione lyase